MRNTIIATVYSMNVSKQTILIGLRLQACYSFEVENLQPFSLHEQNFRVVVGELPKSRWRL